MDAVDFFISHASEDLGHAESLHPHLNGDTSVFLDRQNIAGGAIWPAELENALYGARCVVVLLSPQATKKYWVREEIYVSIARHIADPENVKVVPVVLPAMRASTAWNGLLPFGLNHINRVDWQDGSASADVAAQLKGRGAASATAVAPPRTTSPTAGVARQRFHPLLDYPAGPLLPPHVWGGLTKAYAMLRGDPVKRIDTMNRAIAYRKRAEPKARTPELYELQPVQETKAIDWWSNTLWSSSGFGPRMVVALLDVIEEDLSLLPDELQGEWATLKSSLKSTPPAS